MPGKVKIKFYDKGLFDGASVDLSVADKNGKTTLYVDKTIKSEIKKEKVVENNKEKKNKTRLKNQGEKEEKKQVENIGEKNYQDQTEPTILAKNNPRGQSFVRERTDREAGGKKQIKSTETQLDMFGDIGVEKQNYKYAKKLAKAFFEDASFYYEHYLSQNNKISFDRKQMLNSLNEYLQAMFVAVEFSKGENANENNLQFALEISWFSNIFDSAKSLLSLSKLAKTKLLQVPEIFMITVVNDARENTEWTKNLYDGLKKVFLSVYENILPEFNLLTRPIVNFLKKQGVTL